MTSRLLSSTWMRPPARSHGVEDPVLAIAHQVARSAAADQWFPDLRRTPQTQISLLAERRRCALYRIRLLGPDVQHEVLLKLRRPGGLRTGATQTPSRPALAPCLALTEQERAAFEFQGLERAVAAVVAADPPAELGAVRPLLLLQEQAALVMDYIPHRTLRDRLHAAHRVGRVGAAPPLTLVGAAAGKWLRHLHATGSEQPHGTRLTSGLEVAALLPQFADHLARLLGERSLLARVRTAGEVLAHALPERLPSAVLHGDFAPRNVLVSPTGGVLVVDPMPTWRAAVHEDVARLLVGARLTRLQLVTGGLAIAPEELDGHEKAFLRAYYGDEDERLEVGAFCLLVALDQWAALLAQLSPTTGRLRGVAGVEARWVGRTVEAEVQRRLDAVERLVQSPLVGRAAGAAPTT